MQALFITIAILGGLWFAWARRPVDLFSVAYGSACIYFMPGFFGFALMLSTPDRPYKLPIQLVPDVYLVMITVLLAVWGGAVIYDYSRARVRTPRAIVSVAGSEWVPIVASALAVLLFLVTLVSDLPRLLSVDKSQAIEAVGRTYTTFTTAASVGLVTAFACRRYLLVALCFALLVFDLYIGFRFSMAISLIAIALIYFQRLGPVSFLRDSLKPLLLILFVGQFFFLYQNIKTPLKSGDIEEVQRRLSDISWHIANFATSEPFITQSILNEVIRTDFTAPSDHFTSAVYHFIILAPELGAQPRSFNSYFQPVLYRNVESGVASNIWAQFWTLGGLLPVVIAAIGFSLALRVGSNALRRTRGSMLGIVSLLGAGLAFYIQRNELTTLMVIEKRILMVVFASVIGAWLARRLAQQCSAFANRGQAID